MARVDEGLVQRLCFEEAEQIRHAPQASGTRRSCSIHLAGY